MPKLTPRQRLLEDRARKSRITNSRNERFSGAGSQFDYGTENRSGPRMWINPMELDRELLTLFKHDWAARKIVSIPVDDMLREGWELKGLAPDQLAKVEDNDKAFNILDTFRKAKRLEGLFGGSAIFIGAVDGNTDTAQPLNVAAIDTGALKYLNVVPRSRISRTEFNTNPTMPGYGRPEHFWIQGLRVHRSRLILFKGDPLLDVPESTIALTTADRMDGFGDSKLLAILDDLVRATGSRQAAFQLVQRAGVFFASVEESLDDGTAASDAHFEALRGIVNQVNAFRGAVFTTTPGQSTSPISTISPTFGSVPELVMSFLQVLSAASDIPATRFLGQAPGGLNATGESDLENYYGRLASEQKQVLSPQLQQYYQIAIPSVLGRGVVSSITVDIEFPELWSLSEKEQAEVRKIDAETINIAVGGGWMTTDEAAAESNAKGITETPLAGAPDVTTPDEAAQLNDPAAPPLAESLAGIAGEPGADPTSGVAPARLNGAQITAAIEVAGNVSGGKITRDAGLALLQSMGVPAEQAEKMLGVSAELAAAPAPAPGF